MTQLLHPDTQKLVAIYSQALTQPDPLTAIQDIDNHDLIRAKFANRPNDLLLAKQQAGVLEFLAQQQTGGLTVIPPATPIALPSDPAPIVPAISPGAVDGFAAPPQEPVLSELDERGKAIEEGYNAHNMKVRFCPPAISGLRHDRFVFEKPVASLFGQYENRRQEVLSHAGYDPTLEVIFRPLRKNLFEIQVPRDPETWKVVSFIPSFPGAKEALSQLSRDGNHVRCLESLRHAVDEKAWSPLRSLNGLDMDGNPIWVDLRSHCLILGDPDGGKSVGVDVMLSSMFITLPPQWLQVVMWDLKDGLTLKHYEGLPYLWKGYPVLSAQDGAAVKEMFAELRREKEQRGKDFAEAGVHNLMEFNQYYPNDVKPWLPLLIEELPVLPRILGAEETKSKLGEALREWRAAGLPVICTAQYASEDTGLGPASRVFGSVIAFKTSEQAAKLAFGGSDSTYPRIASRLAGRGDMLVKQQGRYIRGQGMLIDRNMKQRLKDTWLKQYGVQPQQVRDPFATTNPFSGSAQPTTTDPEYAIWLTLQQALQKDPKLSQNAQFELAFGHLYDDPKSASSGPNLNRNKTRLEKIKQKYGGTNA